MARWVSVTQKVEGRKTYAQALMGEIELNVNPLWTRRITLPGTQCCRNCKIKFYRAKHGLGTYAMRGTRALSKAMKESRGAWLEEWFDYVKEWLEEFTYTSRQTWIASYGVPLHAWNVFMFRNIANTVGESICMDG
ncbi:protein of unknown function DUF4283 - like 10 [Theobroma cacao]|nr:protein of unknown function DUF4283 - like 10 [Theobroma cacao]